MQKLGEDLILAIDQRCDVYDIQEVDEGKRIVLWGHKMNHKEEEDDEEDEDLERNEKTDDPSETIYLGDIVIPLSLEVRNPVPFTGVQKDPAVGETKYITRSGFVYSTLSFSEFDPTFTGSIDKFARVIRQVLIHGEGDNQKVYLHTDHGIHILSDVGVMKQIPIFSQCIALRGNNLFAFQNSSVFEFSSSGVLIQKHDLKNIPRFNTFFDVKTINSLFVVQSTNAQLWSIDEKMKVKKITSDAYNYSIFVKDGKLFTVNCESHTIRIFEIKA